MDDAGHGADLIGVWSSEDCGLYYSTFEDERVAFRADGSGWYEFARPQYAKVALFMWREIRPSVIALSWGDSWEVRDGTRTDTRRKATPAEIACWVADEETPLAGRVQMLRIYPAVGSAREFGRRSEDPDSGRRSGASTERD